MIRTKVFYLALVLCALSSLSHAIAVSVSSPTNGATVTSPVHVSAQASSGYKVTGWWIYVDGQGVYHGAVSPSLSVDIPVATGTHTIMVRAWNSIGKYASKTLTVNVTSGSSTPPPTPTVSVAISPTSTTLQTGQSQQFAASVSGTTNTAVSWFVNGVQGGNSTMGTISASGLYTAPASVPSGSAVTVTATSAADTTKSASASVSISSGSSAVSMSISPTSVTVPGGKTQQFNATVSGTSNTGVLWSVNGVQGGNSTYGSISTSGLYTAPPCPSTSSTTVKAQSVYDGTVGATSNVTLSSSSSASASDRYVAVNGSDSNDGDACHPWATIQHAVSAATAGVTIHVGPGTYNEAITINNSGTSTARIRVVSDQEWGAKIMNTSYFMVTINGSYVDFAGFELVGQSGNNQGVDTYGNYDRVIHNHIHDIPVNTSVCSNGGAGIDNAGSGTGVEFIGNVVHDIGWGATQCLIPNENIHGIYMLGTSNRAVNNISFHNAGFGITAYHTFTNLQILNNTVFRNGSGGIVISSGGSSIPPANTIISDNISVYNTQMPGINDGFGIDVRGSYGSGGIFQNNLLYGNAQSGFPNGAGTPTGTITADPMFVNYTGTISGDYHLQSVSPAIDKGVTANAPTTDLDGGPRPIGSAMDIGAYEYGTKPATWPW